MTLSIFIVLGLLVLCLILFSAEWLPVDLVTLIMLIVLVLTGILTPQEAFAGFSSEIIIILASIFVLGGAFQETGILEAAGTRLMKIARGGPRSLLVLIMASTAGMSSFMNNTTATAVLVPAVTGMARRLRLSPSRFLMPLAFASMLGGTCTLIGTSTNIAVSGYLARAGMAPVGLFEITPVGLILLIAGILYMALVGARFLPEQSLEIDEIASLRDYFCVVTVQPGSALIGQTVFDSDLQILGFRALQIRRAAEGAFTPESRDVFREGDEVSVSGKIANLRKVRAIEGLKLHEGDEGGGRAAVTGLHLVELLVTPHSDLAGRTLKECAFRERFGFTVVAIHRQGTSLPMELIGTPLQFGDVLLAEGTAESGDLLSHSRDLDVLEETAPATFDMSAGGKAALIFAIAVVLGASGWVPLSIAFLSGAVGVILCRCLSLERAYQHIDWRLLILIGGMSAFGMAMEKTGAAPYLGKGIGGALAPWGVHAVLAGFFLLTILLTQPMSNAAAALVVLPVALSTATQLGAEPRTFGIAVMLAASVSFITPFEPSCVLVYGPGQYRFRDFVKVGGGLTVLLAILVLWLLPYFWPLYSNPG